MSTVIQIFFLENISFFCSINYEDSSLEFSTNFLKIYCLNLLPEIILSYLAAIDILQSNQC